MKEEVSFHVIFLASRKYVLIRIDLKYAICDSTCPSSGAGTLLPDEWRRSRDRYGCARQRASIPSAHPTNCVIVAVQAGSPAVVELQRILGKVKEQRPGSRHHRSLCVVVRTISTRTTPVLGKKDACPPGWPRGPDLASFEAFHTQQY